MLFNSYHFLCFFPVVVLLFYLMPVKLRKVWLLLASYYFYMSWNPKYGILLLGSTGITYITGIIVGRENRSVRKKLWLALSVVANLSVLFVFKYLNFFLESVTWVGNKFHLQTNIPHIDLVLPVGISFYTFQVIGYLIDVYRKKVSPQYNFVQYALFVSFFPQLVAGPIERSTNLLSELENIGYRRRASYKEIVNSLTLMVYGMFIKIVIADRIKILSDYVFGHYIQLTSIELLIGAIAFSIQIYCDFFGYSLIAKGAAGVLGIRLMENFNVPYFSRSIKEFWRRWHISLSSWFRDYIYIPMGGNKCSKVRKTVNLIIVFLISGLWHGASWHFVVWGGLHAAYQVFGEITYPARLVIKEKLHIKQDCFSFRFGQVLCTNILVVFAWIFFRTENVKIACIYILRIFRDWDPTVLYTTSLYSLGLNVVEINILLVSLLFMLAAEFVKYKKGYLLDQFLQEQNMYFRWAVVMGLIVFMLMFGKYGPGSAEAAFLYFQF